MKFALEQQYPRRWRRLHIMPSPTYDAKKYDSLEALIVRRGAMPMPIPTKSVLRDTVIDALPIDLFFSVKCIATQTQLKYEVVGRILSTMLSSGYPLERVNKSSPALYVYRGYPR